MSILESLPGVIGTIGKSFDTKTAICSLGLCGSFGLKCDGLIDLHVHVFIDILHVCHDGFVLFELMSLLLGFDFTLDLDGISVCQ